MKVLSLFDGMSCGQLALKKAGIEYTEYYASEIDKYAIQVTQHNFPDTIQLGDITKIVGTELPKIDLIIGGSPCNNLSMAGDKTGLLVDNLEDYLKLKQEGFEFKGQSFLFWEYIRLLRECKPKYFLLENVKMKKEFSAIITRELGVPFIEINSSLVSAQNRVRLYWTNISNVTQPKNKGIILKDILEKEVDPSYFYSDEKSERVLTLASLPSSQRKGMVKNNLDLPKLEKYIPNEGQFIYTNHLGQNGSLYKDKAATLVTASMPNVVSKKLIRGFKSKQVRREQLNSGFDKLNIIDLESTCSTLTSRYFKGGMSDPYAPIHVEITEDINEGIKTTKNQLVDIESLVIRKLTPIECERLQTVPDNYTSMVSNTQRYKMLGNGWTVDIIAHIFGFLSKVRKKESTPVSGYVVDNNGYLRKETGSNCVNNDENSLKSGYVCSKDKE